MDEINSKHELIKQLGVIKLQDNAAVCIPKGQWSGRIDISPSCDGNLQQIRLRIRLSAYYNRIESVPAYGL